MIRGTTPDFLLTIDGYDITGKRVYVTISQGMRKITKTNDELEIRMDGENAEIGLSLTQQDTLGLMVGSADVQVRMIDENGYAEATDIAKINISRVLLEKVIAYAANTP